MIKSILIFLLILKNNLTLKYIIMSANQKTISYLLIILSIFLLFFVITSQYSKMQEKLDTKTSLKEKLVSKKTELKSLNTLKQSLQLNKKEIEKYTTTFSEDKIIKYIYDYAFDESNLKIRIKNITLNKWIKNELGFIESDINLNIRVENEQSMLNFIDFLLKEKSPYKFFINDFNYPYDNREGSFDISIPLKLFYINQ